MTTLDNETADLLDSLLDAIGQPPPIHSGVPLFLPDTAATIGTYFSGGGLVEVGAMMAGYMPVFGVEYDPSNPKLSAGIAGLYERNVGEHLLRKSVTEIDPAELPAVSWFHASPVCKSFSQANASGEENENDIATAQATAAYISYHRPPFVTIENVWLYRLSESWRIIANALTVAGYLFRVQKVNMADFGVPQSRERMIVTAMPGRVPVALHATHQDPRLIQQGQYSMFGQLPPWIGWYEAIADLIPGLKETKPAQWQEKRLPAELRTLMVMTGNTNLTAADCQPGRGICYEGDPANAVAAEPGGGMPKALLCNTNVSGDEGETFKTAGDGRPAFAVTGSSSRLRAWLAEPTETRDGGIWRTEAQPSPTIKAQRHENFRAYLVDSLNAKEEQAHRNGHEPALTVTAHSSKHPAPIAHAGGRWVKLNTRCLARFQSVPDSYVLSGNNTVDCAVIGNGVPPRFVAEMARQLAPAVQEA